MKVFNRLFSYFFIKFFKFCPGLYKSKLLRHYFTKKYNSGLVAIGERFSRFEAIGPEWIYVDTENCDRCINFLNGSFLPLEDSSVSILYSTHMIEHLTPKALEHFIMECFRVLKPGGYLRFEAPDAEKLINAYVAHDKNMINTFKDDELISYDSKYNENHAGILGVLSCFIKKERHWPVYVTKDVFEEKITNMNLEKLEEWLQTLQTDEQKATNGHNCLIYFTKLKDLCVKSGAQNCWKSDYDASNIPNLFLNNVYRRHIDTIIEGPHRKLYSIYFEAQKASSH
jgi:SAM-dependent methyltransferase